MSTTPPATRRAETSFTGSGNENSLAAAPSTPLTIQTRRRRPGRTPAAAGSGLLDDERALHAEPGVLDTLAVGYEAREHPDALRQSDLALIDGAGGDVVHEVADAPDQLLRLLVLALAQQRLHQLGLLAVLHLEGDRHVLLLAGVDRAHELAALDRGRAGELVLLHPHGGGRLGQSRRRRVLRHLHDGVAVRARRRVEV